MRQSRLLVLFMAIACQPPAPPAAPAPAAERPWRAAAYSQLSSGYSLTDDESLGPDLGLSHGEVADSTIERLLAHRVALPARINVGILHLPGARARGGWFSSSSLADLTQALADSVVAAMSRSSRVGRTSVLPALLVGDRPTVAGLREAAARLQAQVLVVYRPSCRLFERVPFVGAPQYRADCTLETALLDTRAGVLPFSTVITRDHVVQRERGDFDLAGTWRHVQLQALIIAGLEVSNRVGSFLNAVPVQPDE